MVHCCHESMKTEGDQRETRTVRVYTCCWCGKQANEQSIQLLIPGHGPYTGTFVNGNPMEKETCPKRPNANEHH